MSAAAPQATYVYGVLSADDEPPNVKGIGGLLRGPMSLRGRRDKKRDEDPLRVLQPGREIDEHLSSHAHSLH